jgi:thiamine-monophosphate kinase
MKTPITLAKAGEDRIVSEVTRGLSRRPDVVVGPGDDCAVVKSATRGHFDLLKCDAVVEGVHFLPDAPPQAIGWKSACRAVSDIAAMGGWPLFALVTVVARPRQSLDWLREVYRGLDRAARRHRFSIVGGETSRTADEAPAVISVSMAGRVEKNRCLLRSGAHPGDRLFVTGRLGGSRAGWHLRFQPRLDEARWLVKNFRPTAMIDLSDGLAKDLPRLAHASRAGFDIDLGALPRRRGASIAQALGDGEDFELLFTIPQKSATRLERAWKGRFPKLDLTAVGRITPAGRGDPESLLGSGGWDHFAGR